MKGNRTTSIVTSYDAEARVWVARAGDLASQGRTATEAEEAVVDAWALSLRAVEPSTVQTEEPPRCPTNR